MQKKKQSEKKFKKEKETFYKLPPINQGNRRKNRELSPRSIDSGEVVSDTIKGRKRQVKNKDSLEVNDVQCTPTKAGSNKFLMLL